MLGTWCHGYEYIDLHALDIEVKCHCILVQYVLLGMADPFETI